jgi:hypothetical protein
LKSEKEFPEKLWSLKIIDESEDSDDHGKGGNIGSDSGHVFIFFFSKKIGRGRYDKSPGTQSGSEKVYSHNPIPMNVYLPFHLLLLDLPLNHFRFRASPCIPCGAGPLPPTGEEI